MYNLCAKRKVLFKYKFERDKCIIDVALKSSRLRSDAGDQELLRYNGANYLIIIMFNKIRLTIIPFILQNVFGNSINNSTHQKMLMIVEKCNNLLPLLWPPRKFSVQGFCKVEASHRFEETKSYIH